MILSHLSLTNFRTFSRLDANFPNGMLVLVGANAQGKTSILEAIFYLATFSSFHSSNDRQLINFLSLGDTPPVARIVAEIQRDGQSHKLEVRLILEKTVGENTRLKKEILVDGVKRTAQTALGTFNAVIFLPQMTRVAEDSPDERRRYLNLAISQVVPGYARNLSSYARVLEQRNALLKILSERGGDSNQLEYWDEKLAESGSEIILRRLEAVRELEPFAREIFGKISANSENLGISYQPALDSLGSNQNVANLHAGDIKKVFLEKLKHLQKEEIRRGVTTIGPHRDEMRFFSNSVDLGIFGSRGQIRSLLLALKLAEVSWMKARSGTYPVLLLDETQAELDLQRRAELLDYLVAYEQAIFTTTDLALYPDNFVKKATIWNIASGKIHSA
jgi:DNA replication and repair protein RecF